jgi:hypothetical protein
MRDFHHANLLLAVLLLLAFAANLIHWRLRAGACWSYFPPVGKMRLLFRLWAIATLVFALAFLVGIEGGNLFFLVGVAGAIMQQIYSIWFRHRRVNRDEKGDTHNRR